MVSSCIGDDRISNLPKDVICKILSFVTPTKYAIRTSVLSKRWDNLWTLSPKVILKHSYSTRDESDQNRESRVISFTHSVDNLLFLRDCLRLDFFKLHFYGEFSSIGTRASSWICAALMCNVRILELNIDSIDSDLGELPWCLFTCKTLMVLKLSGKFILNVPYHVCLPNLKTLDLSCIIYLGDAGIKKFLSGCPILEDLEFYICEWDQIGYLKVEVASLKRLTLNSDTILDDEQERNFCRHKIVVDAPNLEFLNVKDAWPNDILVKALPNIVEAHIDIGLLDEIREFEKVDKLVLLLQSIVNVKRLFLESATFLILEDGFDFVLPIFRNLVFLEIDYSNGPFRLIDFLRSAPNLEVLSFPEGFYYRRVSDNDGDIDFEIRMNILEEVPECLFHSLKVVEIKNFYGEDVELNVVYYLLENSVVMEKMNISFNRDANYIELQGTLTNHPRFSANCQLDFKRNA